MSEGWPDFWIRGKKIDLIDLIDEINTIHTIETVNSITSISTLDTINTINTVNTIDTINKIRDVTLSEERRRDAIKNGFFNQALTGWYVDYVEIQDTQDPYFAVGYDAVLTSKDSNLVQYLIPFMRKDEVYSLQIRCKGAAAGNLYVMFIEPSGASSSHSLSITDSYATYTVSIPCDVVAGIWIYPAGTSIIPCRIKFISAPLKTKVYQAEKNRTITDITKVSTIKSFDVSASGSGNNAIWTPASGKAIRLKLVQYESDADVEVGLRFGDSGELFARRITKGVMALNLVGCNVQGSADEALNLYVGGAVNVKGFVLGEEI